MVYAQPSICPCETHTWDLPTDHLISARSPDLIIINNKKRTCKIVDFSVLADHRIKLKESKKKDKYLDLARELKKLWNVMVRLILIVIGAFWYSHQRITEETGELGHSRTSGDHPNYNIIENGQNTEKSPGDLGRHAVTQTLVKNYQLKLM